ncbi:MAG: transcription antitermination factor NusB [Phycisphaerales bacterium]|nr:transcription antitermination factor NusB [Phycisphaerales bacterium]
MSRQGPASDVRRAAILALYQLDAGRGEDPGAITDGLQSAELSDDAIETGMVTADAVWSSRSLIDEAVASESTQWPMHRQPAVDRAILRLAAWELLHSDTPRGVVIDEAVRLAHEFGTEKSAGFVNAVLDTMPLADVESSD